MRICACIRFVRMKVQMCLRGRPPMSEDGATQAAIRFQGRLNGGNPAISRPQLSPSRVRTSCVTTFKTAAEHRLHRAPSLPASSASDTFRDIMDHSFVRCKSAI